MTIEGEDWIILKGKYGPAHAFKQAGGTYVLCKRNPALCKACNEHGVPLAPPDPFDVMSKLLRDNWHKRWFELDRYPSGLADNVLDQGEGIHIVARTDDCKDSTVLISLGSDPAMIVVASAIVAVHNEMVGQPA